MYEKSIMNYACIIYYAYICAMKKRPSYLQQYFCLDPEEDFGYLVVTEIVDGTPIASFTVKIPKSFCCLEGISTHCAPSPN